MVQFAPVNPEDIIEYEIELDCDMYKRTLATLPLLLRFSSGPQLQPRDDTSPDAPPSPFSFFQDITLSPQCKPAGPIKGGG